MEQTGKVLIVCCDGTWNRPDQMDRGRPAPTNVVKIARLLNGRDRSGRPQWVYYDAGVGSSNRLVDRLFGGAFGVGVNRNIKQAYRWLAGQYEEGDRICLFGFSRGAYTVRSLAGMIRNVGLLRRGELTPDNIDEAFRIYRSRRREDRPDGARAQSFVETRSRLPYRLEKGRGVGNDMLYFIGVWDTVGALGIPHAWWLPRWLHRVLRRLAALFLPLLPQDFHDVRLSRFVRHACQALALDERRRAFAPAIWQQAPDAVGQTLEQRWFPGVHCNVGGGYADTGLSDLALQWMIARAAAAEIGFRSLEVADTLKPDALGELRDSAGGLTALAGVSPRHPMRGAGTAEAMDEALARRYWRDPSYRPPRLVEWQRLVDPLWQPTRPPALNAAPPALPAGGVRASAHAALRHTNTGIWLAAGGCYEIRPDPEARWYDWYIACGSKGYFGLPLWLSGAALSALAGYLLSAGAAGAVLALLFALHLMRPKAGARWMSLLGTIDAGEEAFEAPAARKRPRDPPPGTVPAAGRFRLGRPVALAMPRHRGGILHLAPNDLPFMLFNNAGRIEVAIRRLDPHDPGHRQA